MNETDDKKLIHLLWRTMAYMHQVRDELEVLKRLVLKGDQHESPRPLGVCTSYLREECGLENVWQHAKQNIYPNGRKVSTVSTDSGMDPKDETVNA